MYYIHSGIRMTRMTSITQHALYKKQTKLDRRKTNPERYQRSKPKNGTLSTLIFGASIRKGNDRGGKGQLDMQKVLRMCHNILGEGWPSKF